MCLIAGLCLPAGVGSTHDCGFLQRREFFISCIKASSLWREPCHPPPRAGNITPAMRDTLVSSTGMPEVSAHSGPAKASPFVPVACRITYGITMLVPNPHKYWMGNREQSHGRSKMPEETKSLEKPVLQCLCMAAGTAGPPQGPEQTGGRLERVRRFGGFNTCSTTGVLGHQCKCL